MVNKMKRNGLIWRVVAQKYHSKSIWRPVGC